jgi:hypothetical protein
MDLWEIALGTEKLWALGIAMKHPTAPSTMQAENIILDYFCPIADLDNGPTKSEMDRCYQAM